MSLKMNNSDEYYDITNKLLQSEKVIEGNINLWTTYLDECLTDFVILYNFNFFDIASKFHNFISFPYKYEFSEDEVKRHWAFLHAARVKNITIDEDYYELIRSRKNKLLQMSKETKDKLVTGDEMEDSTPVESQEEIERREQEMQRKKELEREKENQLEKKDRLEKVEEQVCKLLY